MPRDIIPLNYRLTLSPETSEKVFNGLIIILVNVKKPTQRIILHSNKLNITNITVQRNESSLLIKSFEITTDDREFLFIDLNNELKEGIYDIAIEFWGRLDDGIIGFYGSTLKNGQ